MAELSGHPHRVSGVRVAIVASRFNRQITDRLVAGARDTLLRLGGIGPDDVTLAWVPGAFELSQAARKLLAPGGLSGIIAVGAVIRGATPHFEAIVNAASVGLATVAGEAGLPLGFGLVTADTFEQALERADGKLGNKGAEAALAVLEMIDLFRQLEPPR